MRNYNDHLKEIFDVEKPIIGMIHLKPLPGSPLYDPELMPMSKIIRIAIEEAKILEEAGLDGLQVENIWDYPYLKNKDITYETVSSLSVATHEIKNSVAIPVGVNCHLNGGFAALAAAVAAEANWIRVFEWVNAYVSHAGIIEGIGGKLARYRSFLKSNNIKFLCDVNVKHGSHFIISDRTIAEQAHDAESEGAEVLIVTGFKTGEPPSVEDVSEFCSATKLPVLIGSGITKDNAVSLLKHADGAIVGSYFKKDGVWKENVQSSRAVEFMNVIKSFRKEFENE